VDKGNKAQSLEKTLVQLLGNKILPEGSYLAGGTALYYYLHHRLSIDLDFFVPKPFNAEALVFNMRERLETVFTRSMSFLKRSSPRMFSRKGSYSERRKSPPVQTSPEKGIGDNRRTCRRRHFQLYCYPTRSTP
jgi:hypothetical protein